MSRRTKKEKLIADLRRKIASYGDTPGKTTVSKEEPVQKQPAAQSNVMYNYSSGYRGIPKKEVVENFSYVKKDLTRILVITFLVLAIQFIIYLFERR